MFRPITATMILVMCFVGTSCRGPQDQARLQLDSALKARQARHRKSMAAYWEGRKAYGAGQLEQAHEDLSEAVGIEDRNVYAWILLGVIEFQSGRAVDAAKAFERAASLAPDRYEPYYNLGLVLEACGRYRDAQAAYERALHRAPECTEVLENLVRCQVRAGLTNEKTREFIDRAIAFETRVEWTRWLAAQRRELSFREAPP